MKLTYILKLIQVCSNLFGLEDLETLSSDVRNLDVLL